MSNECTQLNPYRTRTLGFLFKIESPELQPIFVSGRGRSRYTCACARRQTSTRSAMTRPCGRPWQSWYRDPPWHAMIRHDTPVLPCIVAVIDSEPFGVSNWVQLVPLYRSCYQDGARHCCSSWNRRRWYSQAASCGPWTTQGSIWLKLQHHGWQTLKTQRPPAAIHEAIPPAVEGSCNTRAQILTWSMSHCRTRSSSYHKDVGQGMNARSVSVNWAENQDIYPCMLMLRYVIIWYT
jgi:hypothetical protein